MNKTKVLLLLVLTALLGAYFFLGTLLGRGITAAVNKYGPPLTGTTVTLGAARLSPFTGAGSLGDLRVGNPSGFKTAKAFSVDQITVKVKPMSLLGDTIEVEEVIVRNPEFIFETTLLTSNLGTILANIEKNAGIEQRHPASTAAEADSAKKLIIRHFILEGAKANITAGKTVLTVPLATLELHDVGVAKGGVTPAEAAAEILPQVISMVTRTAVSTLGDRDFRDKAVDFGTELGAAAEQLFNEVTGKAQKKPQP